MCRDTSGLYTRPSETKNILLDNDKAASFKLCDKLSVYLNYTPKQYLNVLIQKRTKIQILKISALHLHTIP